MQADRTRDPRFLDVVRAIRTETEGPLVVLAGDSRFEEAWGPLVSVRARERMRCFRGTDDLDRALAELEAVAASRRRRASTASTGLAILLSYEFGSPWGSRRPGPAVPDLIAWEIDAAVVWSGGRLRVETADGDRPDAERRVRRAIERGTAAAPLSRRLRHRATTSLPRHEYLAAVQRIRERIVAGDIYQANLTQTFQVEHSGDRFETFVGLVDATPAPRAAFVDGGDVALASVSPELFVDVDPAGHAETRPIKGTRPRASPASEDSAAAAALLTSPKDRAELLMIVDLERNDLGRVCRTGSVEVPELASLRSFAAVHHLVARVTGRFRKNVGLCDWVAATFPGGSITGAPKRRAMEILADVEPWRRGWFTGSLLWIGDDGSVRSSILIRSVAFEGSWAWLGAGGGVVADSDPEQEWLEANAKARAPAAVLGFDPEEVS